MEGADHSEAMVPIAGRGVSTTLFIRRQYDIMSRLFKYNLHSALAGRNALHVDVHMASGFIYWCDFSSTVAAQNGVRRIKPDGSGLRSLVTSGIGRNGIRGIAVDWVAGIV